MSFLERLKISVAERVRGYPKGKCLVTRGDLRDLIYHFERLDKQIREEAE